MSYLPLWPPRRLLPSFIVMPARAVLLAVNRALVAQILSVCKLGS
jgi:hypothetical protein